MMALNLSLDSSSNVAHPVLCVPYCVNKCLFCFFFSCRVVTDMWVFALIDWRHKGSARLIRLVVHICSFFSSELFSV